MTLTGIIHENWDLENIAEVGAGVGAPVHELAVEGAAIDELDPGIGREARLVSKKFATRGEKMSIRARREEATYFSLE